MPSPSNGTTIAIPLLNDNSSSLPAGGWWARLVASSELSIKVQVCHLEKETKIMKIVMTRTTFKLEHFLSLGLYHGNKRRRRMEIRCRHQIHPYWLRSFVLFAL